MNEQRKYEVIKSLLDHLDTANKDRDALILVQYLFNSSTIFKICATMSL